MSTTTKTLRKALDEAATALERATQVIAQRDGLKLGAHLTGEALATREAALAAGRAYRKAVAVRAEAKAVRARGKADRAARAL